MNRAPASTPRLVLASLTSLALVSLSAACSSADGAADSTVTVVASPNVVSGTAVGTGEVSSIPDGIDCFIAADGTTSGTCEASFTDASQVTLTATPTAPAVFGQWIDTATGADFTYEESAAFPSPGTSQHVNPIFFDVDSGRTLSVAVDFSVSP